MTLDGRIVESVGKGIYFLHFSYSIINTQGLPVTNMIGHSGNPDLRPSSGTLISAGGKLTGIAGRSGTSLVADASVFGVRTFALL